MAINLLPINLETANATLNQLEAYDGNPFEREAPSASDAAATLDWLIRRVEELENTNAALSKTLSGYMREIEIVFNRYKKAVELCNIERRAQGKPFLRLEEYNAE